MSGASDDRYVCLLPSTGEFSTDRYLVGAQRVDSSNLPQIKTDKTTSSGGTTLVMEDKVRSTYQFYYT